MSFWQAIGEALNLAGFAVYGVVVRLLIPGAILLFVVAVAMFAGVKLLRFLGQGRVVDETKLKLGYWVADLIGIKVVPIQKSAAASHDRNVVQLQRYRDQKRII